MRTKSMFLLVLLKKNDINLKIDFLIRNGYTNAQKYP